MLHAIGKLVTQKLWLCNICTGILLHSFAWNWEAILQALEKVIKKRIDFG